MPWGPGRDVGWSRMPLERGKRMGDSSLVLGTETNESRVVSNLTWSDV